MRAALYARFSTELQRQESIDDQYRVCERVASSHGFDVVERYRDEAISGGTAERPGYQDLLAGARAGRFDVIVAEDVSRLWRNVAEFGARAAELEDIGVHLVTATGDDSRRDGYGLLLTIKAAMAAHQRREISYRTRRGMEGLALSGKSTGGKCYGYAPGEAEVVRGIFRDAAEGLRPSQIAALLNARGVPGPRGPRWSLNAVKRILRNERYRGKLIWGATETRGGARDSRRKRHVRRADPVVIREAPALAIVTPALWESVQC